MRKKGLAGVGLVVLLVAPVLFLRKPEVASFVFGARWAGAGSREKGPAHASIRITEYSNFRCSSCRDAKRVVEALLDKYPGRIRFEFRHFPQAADPLSLMAHVAAECAARQGRFWAYHDRLFDEQMLWSSYPDPRLIFVRYARELNLDPDRFVRDLGDPLVLQGVLSEAQQGRALGVVVTPAFFIGDRRFVGPHQFQQEAARWIEEALRKKR